MKHYLVVIGLITLCLFPIVEAVNKTRTTPYTYNPQGFGESSSIDTTDERVQELEQQARDLQKVSCEEKGGEYWPSGYSDNWASSFFFKPEDYCVKNNIHYIFSKGQWRYITNKEEVKVLK